jgi:predicted KAP-like P-loop ATPase
MKHIPPNLNIAENEGFAPDKDIFQRKKYAETLTSLIENVDDELVIALDAPWGEGKTTFVKMWIGMLNEGAYKDHIKTVYFDAYKNDFLEDPMLVLAGEVNNLLEQLPEDKIDTNKRTQYRKSALNALKVFARAGVRVSLRALTAGVVDDTVLEDAKVEGETVDIVEKYLTKRLLSIEEDRKVLNSFLQTIEGIVNDLGDNAKLIFFIDELDRCKLSFALDLLETIKHIFSVPGVVFVLVTHKEQMQEIIRTRYGAKVDFCMQPYTSLSNIKYGKAKGSHTTSQHLN